MKHCFKWILVQEPLGVRSLWGSRRWGKATAVWHLWVCWRYCHCPQIDPYIKETIWDLIWPKFGPYFNSERSLQQLGTMELKLQGIFSTQHSRWFNGWHGRSGWLPWKYWPRGAFQVPSLHSCILEACLDFIDLGQYLVIGQVATRLQGASILAR